MSIQLDVPIVSQLTSITTDGKPSENREDDCVAAGICMLAMYLKGVHTIGGIYTPDNFKDKSAGQGYVGFTAAVQYIAYCAALGVRLYHQDGSQAQLIQDVRTNLSISQQPTIFTEPDPYMQGNFSHVCIFIGDTGHSLVAIDPFIAKTVERSYSEWQGMLQFEQVWTGELMQGSATTKLTPTTDDMHVWNLSGGRPFFVDHAIEQSWLRAKHNHHIELGPPQEDEQDGAIDVRRLFLMGRAVYAKTSGVTTWYLCTGPFTF